MDDLGIAVQVCRSKLDPGVWFTYAHTDGFAIDLSDCEFPGRLAKVKRYALDRYARDATSARWRRVDPDTYELEITGRVSPAGIPGEQHG
jgi:hypothetical protein